MLTKLRRGSDSPHACAAFLRSRGGVGQGDAFFFQLAKRKFTPQTSVQFDYGPSVDEAEEERTEMGFLTAPECFVKASAETQESVFLTVSPSAIEALMPTRFVG